MIGKGSPKQGRQHEVHGAPLGADEVAATRKALGWPHPPFEIPETVYAHGMRATRARALRPVAAALRRLPQAFPEQAAEFKRRMAGELPADFAAFARARARRSAGAMPTVATRKASQNALDLQDEAARNARRLGRSDRLELTNFKGSSPCAATRSGHRSRQPHQLRRARIRHERGHERHRPARRLSCRTAARSSRSRDYSRNAIRMAALMRPARDLRADPRFDRPRRGRSDASADRARREFAADPESARAACPATRPKLLRRGSRRSNAPRGRPA